MRKTFELSEDEKKYTLKNTNPNEKKSPFMIEKETLEFNSELFYEYVFRDVTGDFDIEVILLQNESDSDFEKKQAKRVCDVIQQICSGVIEEMRKKNM